ncbi:MAG: hypothetical protein ACKER6_01270 [Candidatus Hodgkinia cicadicola]
METNLVQSITLNSESDWMDGRRKEGFGQESKVAFESNALGQLMESKVSSAMSFNLTQPRRGRSRRNISQQRNLPRKF